MEETRITLKISKESKERFDKFQKQLGVTQPEAFDKLLDTYLNVLALSDEERKDVDEATGGKDERLVEIALKGLVTESRKINSLATKKSSFEDLSMEDLKQRKMRFKGVAEERIRRCVEQIMAHNDNQSEPLDRVCITPTLVGRVAGSNQDAVKTYFERHKLTIDDHNLKLGLTPAHNKTSRGESMLKIS